MATEFQPLAGLRVAVVGSDGPAAPIVTKLLRELGAGVDPLPHGTVSTGHDILIADRVQHARHDDWLAALAADPPRAAVTLSAYGLTGPRSGWIADEATLQAAGGLSGHATDAETGAPAVLPGTPALTAAALEAVLAGLHARDLARAGEPVHLDLSAHEAAVAQGPVLELLHALMGCVGAPGSGRLGRPSGIYRCRSGLVLVVAIEDHQRERILRLIGDEEKIAHWSADIDASADEIGAALEAWCLERDSREAEAAFQAEGVPASMIATPEDLAADEHLRARGFWDGAERPAVPLQAAVRGGVDAVQGEGLTGLRVLIAGAVLAVPLAGAVLAALGAEVLRVEAPDRLDVYRRNGPFIGGERDIDNGAYFAGANFGVASASVDPVAEPERRAAIVAGADVVIENIGAKPAALWRVDRASLQEDGFPGLGITSTGYGNGGPRSGYRAYAYNIHAYAGTSFDAAGRRLDVRNAMADIVTAHYIALLVAAWAHSDRRTPLHLDIAMSEIVASRTSPLPAELQGVHLATASGPVVALSAGRVADAAAALGVDDLASAAAELPAEQLVERLQAAGIPAATVATAPELMVDEHLRERAFFPRVGHPLAGEVSVIGLPWLVVGVGREQPGELPRFGSSRGWATESAS